MTQREPDDHPQEEARAKAASEDDTDVVLDIPVLNVEELDLEVEELRAHISARAELASFLNISVGVDAYVDKVKLRIKGVEAQVQLKVKLERILGSIDRALQAIDNNPQLLDPNFRRSQDAEEDAGEEEGPRELNAGPEADPGEPAGDPGRDGSEPAATPAARKKAQELGLDLSAVEGTGAGGRVLVRDVLQAAGG
ncbi:MAG TPA: E3 binding domain-containing protein [Rubrobacter sp.]|nr:E3 binding domain-containing protein [Rubrobacter sp.]